MCIFIQVKLAPLSPSCTSPAHVLIIPLVSQAGFAGAGVTDMTEAKDKLMVFESQTASHAGTGIGPPIRCTHWNKAIRTTTGKTCRRTRIRLQNILRFISFDHFTHFRLLKLLSMLTYFSIMLRLAGLNNQVDSSFYQYSNQAVFRLCTHTKLF